MSINGFEAQMNLFTRSRRLAEFPAILFSVLLLAACGGGGGGGLIDTPDGGGNGGGNGDGNGDGNLPPPPGDVVLLHDDAVEPQGFTVVGNKAFFTALDSDDGYGERDQVWVTDGTQSGTSMVVEMNTNPEKQGYAFILTPFKNGVVLTGYDGTTSGGLWFTDGTSGGTYLIKDISADASENVFLVGTGGDHFYFMADDDVHGSELWVSDGTPAGTYMIVDRNPDGDSRVENAQVSTYWDGYFYLYMWHYDAMSSAYPQLYRTDGTLGNLEQLTNSTVAGSVLLDYDMAVFKDRLYFTWHSPENGVEIWFADSNGNVQLFKDLNPEYSGWASDGWPSQFDVLDDTLLFFAYDQSGSFKSLWASDGTSAGTQVIGAVDPGVLMDRMVMMNGKYYFAGRTHAFGPYSLWSTDGTSGGTAKISDVEPDDFDMSEKFAVIGDRIAFSGTDHEHGFEPWVTDGTSAGTFMLKDIHPTTGSYTATVMAGWMTVRGEKAVFVAAVDDEDFQLFETDGTTEGTKIVAPEDATVTVNPMGHEGFASAVGNAVPVRVGNALVFMGAFHGGQRLYAM